MRRFVFVALALFSSRLIGAEPVLQLPPREAAAASGSQFLQRIDALSPADREAAILKEITRGNIPEFLRRLIPVEVAAADPSGSKRSATYFVTADYLAVGSDEDFARVPMRPQTASAIAKSAGASLITVKMSNDIFQQSALKLPPRPLTKDREKAATFFEHHQIIEVQRNRNVLGLLIAGIKKDVVLTNRLNEKPNRVAIYGWHYPDGKPIQPLYVGHSDWHVDYSHGIRLVSRQLIVDGQDRDLIEVLKDPRLSVLISNEGPIEFDYQ